MLFEFEQARDVIILMFGYFLLQTSHINDSVSLFLHIHTYAQTDGAGEEMGKI